jgi:hypothetical protein
MLKLQQPSRSARLLLESGTIVNAANAHAGARACVLSRALCRFRLYRAPTTIRPSHYSRAARTFAELNAPFEDSGWLILRAPAGAEIWYWDKSKLGSLPKDARVSPEAVWQAPGDGWRIVSCAEGYDAQYWSGKRLVASSWRRGVMTSAQWAAFVLGVGETESPAPSEPPAPVSLSLGDRDWRRRVIGPAPTWRDAERVGGSMAICGAALAAFFAGQALNSEGVTRREQSRLAQVQETLRSDPSFRRAMDQSLLIREYNAAVQHPRVLLAAAEAHSALATLGLRASSWRASDRGLSVIVDALGTTPVQQVVDAIEAAEHLCGAVPEIAGPGQFEVRVSVADPDGSCIGGDAETPS